MISGFRINKSLASCLTAIFVLSEIFSCNPLFAQEITYPKIIAQLPPITLSGTKISNTSQTVNSVDKNNTFIPYNLRGDFDESDYFSSSIEDSTNPNINSPPEISELNFPSPSEYANSNHLSKNKKTEDFTPKVSANSFFAPVNNDEETGFVMKNPSEYSSANVNRIKEESNIANFEPQENYVEELNLEGLKVANIEVNGLETLDSETVLSYAKTQKGDIFNSNLLQEDLQNIYASGSFSDNMSIEPSLNDDGTVNLVLNLQENVIVRDVEILGNTVFEKNELDSFIVPLKGKPQNLNLINETIQKITDYYHEKGYILANISSVEEHEDGSLSLVILEGVINDIKIAGNEKTQDYVIKRNILTQAGTVYNEEYLKKDLAKIFSTQIFEEVDREITPSEEQEGSFDVIVVVKEKSTNSIALGGGIDTGLGAFGSISFSESNFLGKAQRVSLSGILGSGILLSDASIKNHINYQAELSFYEPYFLNADNSLMSKLYFAEMGSWNVPLAIERRIGLKAGIEHKVRGNEHLRTSFSAGVEHINLKEGDFNRISHLYAANNLNIKNRAKQLSDGFFVNLTPGINYSKLDNYENPREGIMAQAQFNEAIGISDFNHTNGRLSGAVTKFFPVFKKSTFSLTGKAGIKVHGDEMPEVMAYRLGGPYTIRGFRMSGVGTGDSFLMGSAELATPLPFVDRLKWDIFKKMRLTFFVDAGKVFDPTISNILYDRPEHAITAGIGLRIFVPGLGPISVDYGIPITNPGRYGSSGGYFTFGSGGLNNYGYGY